MEFATQSAFPAAYQKDLFVALHGSWNATGANIRDCQVERIVLQNGVPVSSETFVNGWRAPGLPCGDAATWGRPADVIFGPDGSMFISDDKGNRVYRLVYVGP
jgi:glucose/arabinose dehydrogenase